MAKIPGMGSPGMGGTSNKAKPTMNANPPRPTTKLQTAHTPSGPTFGTSAKGKTC